MPSSMIHLQAAMQLNQFDNGLFYIGSIAPDAVSNYLVKDETHFRSAKNREMKLIELAQSTETDDAFAQGALFHLYLDWKWDAEAMNPFIKHHGAQNWFSDYRNEISLASAYIFHHAQWCTNTWEKMLMCNMNSIPNAFSATKNEINDYVCKNHKWHQENNIGPSKVFTQPFIDEFTLNTVEKFHLWRNCNKNYNEIK